MNARDAFDTLYRCAALVEDSGVLLSKTLPDDVINAIVDMLCKVTIRACNGDKMDTKTE